MIQRWVRLKLASVDLEDSGNLLPHELSGGMLKRAALAKAMVLDPACMIYDEPLVGQDPNLCEVIASLLCQFHKNMNLSTIIISHQVDALVDIVDYVVAFDHQEMCYAGPKKSFDWKKYHESLK